MILRERLASLEAKRLAIGLVQGGLLFALLRIARDGNWPRDFDFAFSPLICVALLIPTVAISGLGKLRRGPLLSWVGIATVVIAMLGFTAPIAASAPRSALRGRAAAAYCGARNIAPFPPTAEMGDSFFAGAVSSPVLPRPERLQATRGVSPGYRPAFDTA